MQIAPSRLPPTFVAEEIDSLVRNDILNPHLEQIHIEFSFKLTAATGNGEVMLVLSLSIQEFRIHLQHPIQAEGIQLQQVLGIHRTVLTPEDGHLPGGDQWGGRPMAGNHPSVIKSHFERHEWANGKLMNSGPQG